MEKPPINPNSLIDRIFYWIISRVIINIFFRIIVYLWLGREGLIAFGFAPPPVPPGPIVRKMTHSFSPEIVIELPTELGLIEVVVTGYNPLSNPFTEYQIKMRVPSSLEASIANLLNDWDADVVHYPHQENVVPLVVTIPVAVTPERFETYFKTKWLLSFRESL